MAGFLDLFPGRVNHANILLMLLSYLPPFLSLGRAFASFFHEPTLTYQLPLQMKGPHQAIGGDWVPRFLKASTNPFHEDPQSPYLDLHPGGFHIQRLRFNFCQFTVHHPGQ